MVFRSNASNLVPNDTNGAMDILLHDRDSTGFVSVCAPGDGNVLACPCGNPPWGASRGCDNSAGTGGAALSAQGIAYLSLDSLVFTTTGERHGRGACSCGAMPSCRMARSSARESAVPAARSSACT
ncbi:MAG: hypothetical protein IPJ19_21470 [Planctomycetes bacterium]|nr:hypothetical protein [Planctomycetota bacterium]